MKAIIATATNRRIADLYGAIKDGKLSLRPDFQRKFVWNTRHQIEFIETILEGYPFPEIYIADQDINLDSVTTPEMVVDGQQRLGTIFRYIDGDLPIRKADKIRTFSDLTRDQKVSFLSYQVTVRQLGKLDDATIKEVFRRINLTRYPLNAYEIHNAVYDGEFIGLAKEISESATFKKIPSFSESDFSRMQNLGFVLLVMATIENGGYFTGNNELDNYVRKFNDNYPNKISAKKALNSSLRLVNKLNLDKGSTWYRKSNLFTLICELADTAESRIPKDLASRLLKFEQKLESNKDSSQKNDFSVYYENMFTGTNSRQARVIRAEIFRQYILKAKKF